MGSWKIVVATLVEDIFVVRVGGAIRQECPPPITPSHRRVALALRAFYHEASQRYNLDSSTSCLSN
jgi:ribosomal protein S7